MNIFVFGLFYLFYTLLFLLIGVVLYKYFIKKKLNKQSEDLSKQLENFFTNVIDREEEENEEIFNRYSRE